MEPIEPLSFPEGTRSPFARAVAAEVRARMAAQRVNLRDFSARAGFKSHNYVAIRLRDEKPFTLDDVDLISAFFGQSCTEFLTEAHERHEEHFWTVAMELAEEQGRRHTTLIAASLDLDEPAKDAERAVRRLDERVRSTRPARSREEMQQLEDEAARHEGGNRKA